jgi:hypothetical protein
MTIDMQNNNFGVGTDSLFSLGDSSSLKSQPLNNVNNLFDSGDIQDSPLSTFSSEKTSTKDKSSSQDQTLQQLLGMIMSLLKKLLGSDGKDDGSTSSDDGDIQDPPPAYSDDGSPPPYTPTSPPPAYTATPQGGPDDGSGRVDGVQKAPVTSSSTATQSIGDINVDGGGKNTITVTNTSDKEQNYALFTNPGPGQTSSFGVPNGFVTLKPGESANFKLPEQSSGYVQQMNNYTQADYDAGKAPTSDNFKASRAEYTFNSDGSLYFNDSNIDGYNSALKMKSNGQVAGSSESVLSKIEQSNPNLISVVGGQKVVEGSQFFTDQTNIEARDALDKTINHNDNPGDLNGNTTTYVMPNDDKAVRGTKSNSLTLEFGNA